ncbi:MAG: glycosyltransferase [Acidobacteriota bacterium]
MSRIALVSSEPLRPRMAGIGIRYLEMARHLGGEGFEVVAVSPASTEEMSEVLGSEVAATSFERGALSHQLAGCQAVVAQGQLANDVVLECPSLPSVVDLYDPWLVENLHYFETLGLDPYRNDHATWMLQMSRGDFFLCSSEEQRLYYLGLLTALGRVHPQSVASDPGATGLLGICPFGVPGAVPEHRPWLEPSERPRILFGGLYDWYDPECLLEALDGMLDLDWQLLFVRSPNAGETPQRKLAEVTASAHRRGWANDADDARVRFIDWVPYERRYDLLRDVDLLATTHLPSLETDLSLRTRFLDALVAEVPVLTSQGGAMSRLLVEHGAGWVVPPGDPSELASALRQILTSVDERQTRVAAGRTLARKFSWAAALEPLVEFLRAPQVDPWKEDFAFSPGTRAPADRWEFRARRKLRRLWSGS